jgi:hypothetical protein
MHAADVERAYGAGLRPRPLRETVADTWTWLESLDLEPPQRADRDRPGLDPAKEAAALTAAAAAR